MASSVPPPRVEDVVAALGALRDRVLAGERDNRDWQAVHPTWRESARNLVHYMAMRSTDLRGLQGQLAALGLSSLGRAEASVLETVECVRDVATRLADARPERTAAPILRTVVDGCHLLNHQTESLLGPAPADRAVRIMVTMPGEAADKPALIREMLEAGMDCMRINCAHDSPDQWAMMVQHLRAAGADAGRPCRVLMDLSGPKLRTGPLPLGPRVAKLRPQRDAFGRVTAPARLWLTGDAAPSPAPGPNDGAFRTSAELVALLGPGDRLDLRDARGAKRKLVVQEVTPQGAWIEVEGTTYLVPGTRLRLATPAGDHWAALGDVPPLEQRLELRVGDTLHVVRDLTAARLTPPTIGCTLPEVFSAVARGHPIWFDDGRIGGVVQSVADESFAVEITRTPPRGGRLAADKGINLPETEVLTPSLTPKDRNDLAFIAQHADMVGYSFVRTPTDVAELQAELGRLGRPDLGVVLKIETRRAFERLPELILQAMRGAAVGVMIARGDLAVECGFERLAEIQEELLWICQAAHMPVIWATQVLENLAKDGMPSRAEITDAAMGERAECVMLNKGPHIVAAVALLDDILCRMQAHQDKKRSMLRRLNVAANFPTRARSPQR